MAIEFLGHGDRTTVIRRGQFALGVIPLSASARRKSLGERYLPHVRPDELDGIASTYTLSDVRKAKLAIRLQKYENEFLARRIAYKAPFDRAALTYLRHLQGSVRRLATLDRRSHEYLGAMAAIREVANQRNTESEGPFPEDSAVEHIMAKLFPDGGPKVTMIGGLPHVTPLARATSKWFDQALEVLNLIEAAEAMLAAGVEATSGAGPETMLYGYRLPRLYELVTSKRFGISRSNNKLNKTGGLRFVIDAASITGRSVSAANVESHYRKAETARLWDRASRPEK